MVSRKQQSTVPRRLHATRDGAVHWAHTTRNDQIPSPKGTKQHINPKSRRDDRFQPTAQAVGRGKPQKPIAQKGRNNTSTPRAIRSPGGSGCFNLWPISLHAMLILQSESAYRFPYQKKSCWSLQHGAKRTGMFSIGLCQAYAAPTHIYIASIAASTLSNSSKNLSSFVA